VIRFPFHHDKRNTAPLPTRRRGVVRASAVESSGRGESCVSRGGEGLWGIVRRRGGGGGGRVDEFFVHRACTWSQRRDFYCFA